MVAFCHILGYHCEKADHAVEYSRDKSQLLYFEIQITDLFFQDPSVSAICMAEKDGVMTC